MIRQYTLEAITKLTGLLIVNMLNIGIMMKYGVGSINTFIQIIIGGLVIYICIKYYMTRKRIKQQEENKSEQTDIEDEKTS